MCRAVTPYRTSRGSYLRFRHRACGGCASQHTALPCWCGGQGAPLAAVSTGAPWSCRGGGPAAGLSRCMLPRFRLQASLLVRRSRCPGGAWKGAPCWDRVLPIRWCPIESASAATALMHHAGMRPVEQRLGPSYSDLHTRLETSHISSAWGHVLKIIRTCVPPPAAFPAAALTMSRHCGAMPAQPSHRWSDEL